MRSGAGFYVGTEYFDDEGGPDYSFWGPYDRMTGYYRTKEEAEDVLEKMVKNEMDPTTSWKDRL